MAPYAFLRIFDTSVQPFLLRGEILPLAPLLLQKLLVQAGPGVIRNGFIVGNKFEEPFNHKLEGAASERCCRWAPSCDAERAKHT